MLALCPFGHYGSLCRAIALALRASRNTLGNLYVGGTGSPFSERGFLGGLRVRHFLGSGTAAFSCSGLASRSPLLSTCIDKSLSSFWAGSAAGVASGAPGSAAPVASVASAAGVASGAPGSAAPVASVAAAAGVASGALGAAAPVASVASAAGVASGALGAAAPVASVVAAAGVASGAPGSAAPVASVVAAAGVASGALGASAIAAGFLPKMWMENHVRSQRKNRRSHDGFFTTMTRAMRATSPVSYRKPRLSTCMIVPFSIAGFGKV